jgi:hypothetical protein
MFQKKYFIAQIQVNYENYYLVCGILISICNSNIIVIVYVKFIKKIGISKFIPKF